jgi:hypothetical protein
MFGEWGLQYALSHSGRETGFRKLLPMGLVVAASEVRPLREGLSIGRDTAERRGDSFQ